MVITEKDSCGNFCKKIAAAFLFARHYGGEIKTYSIAFDENLLIRKDLQKMKAKRILTLLLTIVMSFSLVTIKTYAGEKENNSAENEVIDTALADACITVPADTELFVGEKGKVHFISFTEIEPVKVVKNEDMVSYYYSLTDNSTYNYRISSEDYITYAGKFKKTAGFNLTVTEEMLASDGKTKSTIDRDTSHNNGYNVADIYLNINPQGYLKLDTDEAYQLVPLRNWEAVDTITGNYFIEPDYHYTVIDEVGNACEDVINIDENGLITAVGEGTAIVLVTYDALNYVDAAGGPFFGAIWPENTGVFVVSVGASQSSFPTGTTINEGKNSGTIKLSQDMIDAEHDCIYFTDETGVYTFTSEAENVFVANPVIDDVMTFDGFESVEKNDDDSFSIPLKEGRNIVKLQKGTETEYQIITAKKVSISINDGEPVYPGDTLNIVFDKLYHPANKLAGVYNMNALPVYTDVSGYEGQLIGGLPNQYAFASNANAQTVANVLKEKNQWGMITYQKDSELKIPDDYAYDTFTLSGGMIYTTGFGDAYGNHRGITLTDGKAPNFTSEARLGWLGQLPDITIPVSVSDSELASITLDATNVKTDYHIGESFDTANLTVTANYEDGKTQIASNYTVTPEILAEDTEFVTVTYREKTANIAIKVIQAEVTSIEITSPPLKTSYKEGDTFDPTGMIVSLIYADGRKEETKAYSYEPSRELVEEDTEITVSYQGGNIVSVTTPVTVERKSHSGGTSISKLKVYFTLMGDEKHGEPEGEENTHTMKEGNLETWLEKTEVSVDNGSKVIDVIKKALSIAGIPYSSEENYITEIKGLREFDNGQSSGWMYTLNGKYPELGVSEQAVKNNDVIILHYTDDYTVEKTIKNPSSSGSSLSNNEPVTKNEAKTENNAEVTEKSEEDKKEEITDKEETLKKEAVEFKDVKKDSWYKDAVDFVVENNLFNGISENEFAPDASMTRAMFTVVLHRLEKEPEAVSKAEFEDIGENLYYTDAVCWAYENGIVNGMSENEFAPDAEVTREQIAVMIFRYAKLMDIVSEADLNAELDYIDMENAPQWSLEALRFCKARGIMTGNDNNEFGFSQKATRAEAAKIFMMIKVKL